MVKAVQIRNVPEDVHRVLRVRAAAEGLSLSEYLLKEVTRMAGSPTVADLMARVSSRSLPNISTQTIVDAVREGRDRDWPS
jgi:plasmid stability protein